MKYIFLMKTKKMQEPLLLGFVINKGTDHPAHLHSLFSALVCG